MDRVRVGLTGLGAVFLLTLGVSLVFGATDRDATAVTTQKEPGETLAQLGVAPGLEKSPDMAKQQADPPPAPDDEAASESPIGAFPLGPIAGDPAAT